MDATGELSGQIGLAHRDGVAIEQFACDAVLLRAFEIPHRVCKRCIGAKQLDPAVRRSNSGTSASAISASCSMRLRRINGNSPLRCAAPVPARMRI